MTVDYAAHTVQPTFKIEAGPLVKLDGLRLVSAGRTNRRWVASLATWKHGAVYDPALLAKLERRLIETGVYESGATVALAAALNRRPRALARSLVTLTERPRRTLEKLGAAFADHRRIRAKRCNLNNRRLQLRRLYAASGFRRGREMGSLQSLGPGGHPDLDGSTLRYSAGP